MRISGNDRQINHSWYICCCLYGISVSRCVGNYGYVGRWSVEGNLMSNQSLSKSARSILNQYGSEEKAIEALKSLVKSSEDYGDCDGITIAGKEILQEIYKITGRPQFTDTFH
jgi:hypothetical protein